MLIHIKVIEAGKFLDKKNQKTAIYFTDTVIGTRFNSKLCLTVEFT